MQISNSTIIQMLRMIDKFYFFVRQNQFQDILAGIQVLIVQAYFFRILVLYCNVL